MKQLVRITLLIFSTLMLVNHAYAQKGMIQIGGGLVVSSGAFDVDELDNDLGLRVEGIYSFTETVRGAVDITYFFPKEESGIKANLTGINFNGHYIFYGKDALTACGFAGIHIAIMSIDYSSDGFSGSNSESEFGLNLGGGVEYALDFADLFGELRLAGLGGDANQFILAAGLRFGI